MENALSPFWNILNLLSSYQNYWLLPLILLVGLHFFAKLNFAKIGYDLKDANSKFIEPMIKFITSFSLTLVFIYIIFDLINSRVGLELFINDKMLLINVFQYIFSLMK